MHARCATSRRLRLSLADAITRGFANSHRLAEARAREEGARAAANSADLADKPTFNANAGYSRTNHVLNFGFPRPDGAIVIVFPDIPDNFTSRLSFQWPIYTSGRSDALERAAIAEAQAAGADIETARADLRLEIVRAYWAAVTAREAERVLEESTARAEAQVLDAKNRFDVGLIPPNEVSTLEAQRSRERAQLIEATNIREGAAIELRRLIGVPQETVIELTDSARCGCTRRTGCTRVRMSLTSSSRALEARSERKALSFRLGGAEERQKAALTTRKPTVAFAGGFDYAKPNRTHFPGHEPVGRIVGCRRQRQLELLRFRPRQVASRRSRGHRDRDARANRGVRLRSCPRTSGSGCSTSNRARPWCAPPTTPSGAPPRPAAS